LRGSTLERLALSAIFLIALGLRAPGLGDPGLWIDEDLTRLSVDGVLEEGVPRHPSGGIYLRAPLHTYAVSLSASLFGPGEAALRLPSLVFGLLGLWVAYRFARDVAGKGVAFAALLVLTFSGWDVFYARMARMYAPTILLFTLAVWFAWRLGVKGDRQAGPWLVIVGVLATTMHPLAASLAAVFLVLFLLPGTDRTVRWWAWTGILSVALTLVGFREVSRRIWAGGGPAAVPPTLAETSWHIPGLGGLTLEDARFLVAESSTSVLIALLLGAGLIAVLTGGLLAMDRRTREVRRARVPAAAWAVCTALNTPAVAALAAIWWTRWTALNPRDALRRVVAAALATSVTTLLLLGAAALQGAGPQVFSKRALAHVFGVPKPWWFELGSAFPVMMGIAVVGSVLLFLDSFERGDDGSGLFLAGAFAAPLVLIGFVASPYLQLRYMVHLNPLFVLLFVVSLRRIGRALQDWLPGVGLRFSHWTPVGRGALLACVVLLLSGQSSPMEAWGASHLRYGSNQGRVRNPDVVSHFYYDVKTTGEFVAAARRSGDLVVARDGPGTFAYAGPVDYVLRSLPYDGMAVARNGDIVDRNLGVPVLDTVEALEEVIRAHVGGDVWLIVSFTEKKRPVVNLPGGFDAWLRSLGVEPEYTGLDGITKVYRFDPEAASSSTTPSTLPANSLLR
jgi:hypothetical protein